MAVDPVSLAITAALTMASMAMTAMQRFKGPRLDDLEITLADYGAAIPRLWGKRRLQPQIIWAEKLREVKVTSKTKGGKFENFEYYGTWAVLVTDTNLDGYMRMWMDKHLVFQSVEAGPVAPVLGLIEGPFGVEVKLQFSTNLRLYYGTEDQLPDPRMQAWCEDRYGPDSCPAYRGSSYIVFEEIPLEKFGNRIPQITVEVTRGVGDAFPYEQQPGAYGDIDGIDPTFTRLYQISGDQFLTWDLANRTLLLRRTLQNTIGERIGLDSGGFYALTGGFVSPNVLRFDHDGGGGINFLPSSFPGMAPSGCALKGNLLCFYTANTNEEYQIVGYNPAVKFECGFAPTHYFADQEGVTWCVGTQAGDNNLGLAVVPSASGVIYATGGGGALGMDNGNGQFFVMQDATFFFIDKTSFAVVDTVPAPGIDFTDHFLAFDTVAPGARYIWLENEKYDTWTGELLETIDFSDWVSEVGPWNAVYDPVSNAIISRASTPADVLTWRHLDRISSTGLSLGYVVDEVSEWCGLTGQDTSALTQTVYGYSVTQAAGKEMISPLLTLHDVDPRPHDFSVQFVNRGSSPTGNTIETKDFVSDDNNRYKVSIKQDTDLPRRITFSYADGDKDQQINTAIAQRSLDAMESHREEAIDLSTYVEYPASAQKLADRYFRREWNSRERVENTLLPEQLALEPADVKTISLDGVLRNVRLDVMTIKGMSIDCEFIRDETSFAALNASEGAPMEGRDPEVIFVPSQTKGLIVDSPLFTDSDNDVNPIIYVGAGKYIGGWPGASIYRGDDGTYDENITGIAPSGGAVWGIANEGLATANPNVWDRGNTLNVTVFGGTLTSATEAEIDADPLLNLCVLGYDTRWEMIQFTTAVLESDDTYTLSGFKRGRRGTEWAVEGHGNGDTLIMVNNLLPIEMGADDVGDAISYKAQTLGRLIDAAPAIDLTYTGASLKPYAPAIQSVEKDGVSGDITITADRRTRIGGNWNGALIPLGEASEAYELDILDGADVVRTLTSSTPVFTYSSANQTTDLGAPIEAADLDGLMYQMSATVGRGFAAEI